MKLTTGLLATSLTATAFAAFAPHASPRSHAAAAVARATAASAVSNETFQVSGSATHFFSQAVIHSRENTAGGVIQRSTDYIRLTGDLNGYILYHPTTRIDAASNTLVNTGTQIFSGTVAGSEPVILHDSQFRFEVDLNTGATRGVASLGRSGDAPDRGRWFQCQLTVVGTGVTPEGDNVSDYSGECTARGNEK